MNSCSFIDSDSSSGSEDDGDDSSTFTEAHGSEYSSDSGGDCTDKET